MKAPSHLISYEDFLKTLSPGVFWDVDIRDLKEKHHDAFVIQRVFDYGLFSDIVKVIKWFGEESAKKALLSARYLDKKTVAFASSLFHIKPQDFRCSTLRQSNLAHWKS